MTGRDQRLHWRADAAARGPYELEVTPGRAACTWTSLRVLSLGPGESHRLATGEEEMIVLPLNGSCWVECDGQRFQLAGRSDVFSRVTDCAYVPRDADVVISSDGGGRFALPAARCERRLPARYRPAEDVPVEFRGSGNCSRQVNNFCSADSFAADRLIAVEVLTPGGNWSSYPPHKHDEHIPGRESVLEELYYFEVADGPAGPGVGYHRVYGSAERPVDVLAEVRSHDVVVVPHGWHGPSMAAPGYDLYYLNVMAGPDPDRAWHISDDPAFSWVRETWAQHEVDRRLPLTTVEERNDS